MEIKGIVFLILDILVFALLIAYAVKFFVIKKDFSPIRLVLFFIFAATFVGNTVNLFANYLKF